MKVVAHKTKTVQFKRLSLFEVEHRFEKRLVIPVMIEHVLPIVATIHDVVN